MNSVAAFVTHQSQVPAPVQVSVPVPLSQYTSPISAAYFNANNCNNNNSCIQNDNYHYNCSGHAINNNNNATSQSTLCCPQAPSLVNVWNSGATNARYYMLGLNPTHCLYPTINGATTAYLPANPHTSNYVSRVMESTQQQGLDFLVHTSLQPTPLMQVQQPSPAPYCDQFISSPHSSVPSNVIGSANGNSTNAAVAYQRKTINKVPTTLRIALSNGITEELVFRNLIRPAIGIRRDPANEMLYIEFSHARDCAESRAQLEQIGIYGETELTSEKDTTNIYITGIPDSPEFDCNLLRSYFKRFGTIQSTKIVERNGLERVGFVRFQKPEEATSAVHCTDMVIEGRQVICKYANKTRGIAVNPSVVEADSAKNFIRKQKSTLEYSLVPAAAVPCVTVLAKGAYPSANSVWYQPTSMCSVGNTSTGLCSTPNASKGYSLEAGASCWNAAYTPLLQQPGEMVT